MLNINLYNLSLLVIFVDLSMLPTQPKQFGQSPKFESADRAQSILDHQDAWDAHKEANKDWPTRAQRYFDGMYPSETVPLEGDKYGIKKKIIRRQGSRRSVRPQGNGTT